MTRMILRPFYRRIVYVCLLAAILVGVVSVLFPSTQSLRDELDAERMLNAEVLKTSIERYVIDNEQAKVEKITEKE
jgi:Na+-transporting NADH:ubiquinone oxidoreductase subunit NqrC